MSAFGPFLPLAIGIGVCRERLVFSGLKPPNCCLSLCRHLEEKDLGW